MCAYEGERSVSVARLDQQEGSDIIAGRARRIKPTAHQAPSYSLLPSTRCVDKAIRAFWTCLDSKSTNARHVGRCTCKKSCGRRHWCMLYALGALTMVLAGCTVERSLSGVASRCDADSHRRLPSSPRATPCSRQRFRLHR